jgi:hypothetical protein
MKLASDILEARKSKPDGNMTIPTEISINGMPIKVGIPLVDSGKMDTKPPLASEEPQVGSEEIPQTGNPPQAADILPRYTPPTEDDMKQFNSKMTPAYQQAFSSFVNTIPEGKTNTFKMNVNGVTKVYTVQKFNGKPVILSVQ